MRSERGIGEREKFLNVTGTGGAHIVCGKYCQDYSRIYYGKNCTILTACDGHGGELYIRSRIGSRLSAKAFADTIRKYNDEAFNIGSPDILNKLKLRFLCCWNKYVEKHLRHDPISDNELAALKKEDKRILERMPYIAYGSTFSGAAVFSDRVVFGKIGDGGIFCRKEGAFIPYMEDYDCAANVTSSMCGEDAYARMQFVIENKEDIEGFLLCTDGILSPYRTYENFYDHFAVPFYEKFRQNGKEQEIKSFVRKLGRKSGGDDVSLCIYTRIRET